MSGSLLCIAVGTLLLSPEHWDTASAARKVSAPGPEFARVKTLTGYAPVRDRADDIQTTAFAQEILNVAPSPGVQPVLPIQPNVVVGCVEEPGIVFVIGGLGGGDSLATHARRAFGNCCVPHEVCSFNWCHGKGHRLQDLWDHANVDCQSEMLAGQILEYRKQNPTKPIYVLAWSAGVGVAFGAAERLPPDTIDRTIVMCAACSHHYNLCGALRASRCGIVSFHSAMDHFYLNALMRCLGTIDRVHGKGAGITGFTVPCCLSCEEQELYTRRLFQVPWRPHMMLDGHPGGHLWYKSDRFICAHVAPWLRTGSRDFIPIGESPQLVVPEGLPAPNPTSMLYMPPRISTEPTTAELAIQK